MSLKFDRQGEWNVVGSTRAESDSIFSPRQNIYAICVYIEGQLPLIVPGRKRNSGVDFPRWKKRSQWAEWVKVGSFELDPSIKHLSTGKPERRYKWFSSDGRSRAALNGVEEVVPESYWRRIVSVGDLQKPDLSQERTEFHLWIGEINWWPRNRVHGLLSLLTGNMH